MHQIIALRDWGSKLTQGSKWRGAPATGIIVAAGPREIHECYRHFFPLKI